MTWTAANSQPDLPPFVRRVRDNEWHIFVHVLPGAKKSELYGVREGRLCLRLTATAVENKANKALVAFAAETLKIKPSAISIAGGKKARQKRLLVSVTAEPDWNLLLSNPEN
ncbi:MAG: DUF167 domain-containing protein [Desulfovibrio sp.]|jgi:uncharacterized protein (TIGR00251 family)|nr:DUF167 domain-containing protein [Desulfovibrio sp.]